jgi:hypothetical protein
MTKNLQLKKLNSFSKTTIYLSLGRASYKRKKTSKHENSHFFPIFWAFFALLDLDFGYGSIDLIESGSETLHKRESETLHKRDCTANLGHIRTE